MIIKSVLAWHIVRPFVIARASHRPLSSLRTTRGRRFTHGTFRGGERRLNRLKIRGAIYPTAGVYYPPRNLSRICFHLRGGGVTGRIRCKTCIKKDRYVLFTPSSTSIVTLNLANTANLNLRPAGRLRCPRIPSPESTLYYHARIPGVGIGQCLALALQNPDFPKGLAWQLPLTLLWGKNNVCRSDEGAPPQRSPGQNMQGPPGGQRAGNRGDKMTDSRPLVPNSSSLIVV